jgi:hypothetical protein
VVDDQRLAVFVGDVTIDDVELCGATLRGVVMQREIAIDPVPRSVEADVEGLDYVEIAIGADCEQRIEVADANVASLRARFRRERAEKKSN